MREMSADETRDFLLAAPARTAKLATVNADGAPHVVPVWFDLDGERIVFTTGEDTLKGRAIHRDPRVCLCVDDERPPFTYVMVRGTAEIDRDQDALLTWATRIAGRYMGAARAEEYGRRNAVPSELLVRVRPEKVLARTGISD